jgi:pseudouridine-5'-phosphate glycosidase
MRSQKQIECRIAEAVANSLQRGAPVVALESTAISHGLPYPTNLETALACEEIVRRGHATPATIAVVEGVPTIGLSEQQIKTFAEGKTADGRKIEKVGLNNLAAVMVRGGWGATTVASTLRLASAAGIRVFSTGGIGGVHRGAAESFDISADLTALGCTPMICVCAGAKAILALPETLEYLETLGVPVIGYRTEEFPAFYSRSSGLAVDASVETPGEAAQIAVRHWETGSATAVLVCAPVPEEVEILRSEAEQAIARALAAAKEEGIRGKQITPFVLALIEQLTGGRSLKTNQAILRNNAEVGAAIASSLADLLK